MEKINNIPEFDSPKNFPEDYHNGENQYICKCCICEELFYGYKRRVVCNECQNRKQEFENYPKLTEFIQYMAITGQAPSNWTEFLEELNNVLKSLKNN